MRLSPALMAAFATAASVSWSNSAKAQPPNPTTPADGKHSQVVDASVVRAFGNRNLDQRDSGKQSERSSLDVVVQTTGVQTTGVQTAGVQTISAPETTSEPLKTKPFQKAPSKVAQGGTIEQETPNRIQINTSPPATPIAPNLPPALSPVHFRTILNRLQPSQHTP
ncbi:MAG: hypothetical protein HC780_15235, partial [Leptolyngbyaceae cyanobacterium CSU_1_3]|nr:hypothetical protein [Leptolyngbyaceae cyanobacterium CSU_1_3]